MPRPDVEFKFIGTSGPEYAAERELRYEVLRKPLGLGMGAEELPFERESFHLVAIRDGRPIGCLLFKPEGKTGRIYQMAVDEKFRRQGIGSRMLAKMEEHLRDKGFTSAYLHARHHAVSFYEKNGYSVSGEPFIEVGIEHRLMKKDF
jgi:ribosomal protein S18 acetylase RimI-like enzyme